MDYTKIKNDPPKNDLTPKILFSHLSFHISHVYSFIWLFPSGVATDLPPSHPVLCLNCFDITHLNVCVYLTI